MNLVICEDYDSASKFVADIIGDSIKLNPNITLGLATGSTPIKVYEYLINKYNDEEISFENVKTFNLDEYIGLPITHPESYYSFMHRNLFDHINISEENIHIPSNNIKKCDEYNSLLNENKIDLQLLGIGSNGHIGFNEPGTPFDQETFIVSLTAKTREDNKRFFNNIDEVPTKAITMGIKNILDSKRIILMATGENKALAVERLFKGGIDESFPASSLKKHNDVTIVVDKEAAKYILD